MTDNKAKYRSYCEQQPLIPIYMRDWWLDCNCGDKWDVILYENEGRIEAFMTFYQPYKGAISMPMYSQSMGIWFDPAYERPSLAKEIDYKHKVSGYFMERLPVFNTYLQNHHSSFTDWLPFYWKGFEQTSRYNYIFPDISNPDELEKQLSKKLRKNINVAREKFHLRVERNVSTELFMEILSRNYRKKGMQLPGASELSLLVQAVRNRNQGDVLGAYDDQNRLHAVIFVAWQESCAYAIAGGRDPELPDSNAHVLLKWEAIRLASQFSQSYDFQGSMLPGVEFINRQFGAVQVPFFTIAKGKRNLRQLVCAAFNKLKR